MIIYSPRSKKALKQLGLEENKLFFQSLQDYLNHHPEIRSASPEIQNKRYTNYELKRQVRLKRAKEIRNEIIKAEENTSVEQRKTNSLFNLTDSFFNKEMDRLDQMKKHQISEIKSIIDHELQMTTFRHKTDLKIKQYYDQEEQAREQQLKEQYEKIIKQRQEENEREERLKKDDLMQYYKQKKKAEEEQQKKEEENQRKEQLEKESYKRQQEKIKHQEEIQRKLDMLIMKQKYDQDKKQKENEQKEENRKRLFEERKREYFIRTQKINNIGQEKIYKTNNKNEEEMVNRRMTFEKKQKLKHNQMKQYAELLERRNQEHNNRVREKERKIIEFTQKNYLLSLKKIDDYDYKNDYLNQIRQHYIEERQKELLTKVEKAKLLGKDNSERKKKVDALFNLKHVMLLDKYYQSDEKIKLQKEIGYKPTMDKLIDHKIQFEEVNETFVSNNKQFEYKKQMKIEEMTEKSKRVEEYHNRKIKIIEKSMRCQEKMKLRKEEMLNKIHRLLKSGKVLTPEQMYKKIFNKEEYDTLIARTPNHYYKSVLISPSHSLIGLSPKLNIDKEESFKTLNKWHSIKDRENKDESKLIPKGGADEGLFVTQERYKSLDKIMHD